MAEQSVILLSHKLNGATPTYGNRDRLEIVEKSQMCNGDTANSSAWNFTSNHLGSHVDMPRHFFQEGKTLTDYEPADWIFNRVKVIDIPCDGARLIYPRDLPGPIADDVQLLLIRTGYESLRTTDRYWNDNPGLSPELGFHLRELCPDLRAVGFDFISITSWQFRQEGREAHRAFLDPGGSGNALWIFEDLALQEISGPINRVTAAPVFVENSNGSTVTIFAEAG